MNGKNVLIITSITINSLFYTIGHATTNEIIKKIPTKPTGIIQWKGTFQAKKFNNTQEDQMQLETTKQIILDTFEMLPPKHIQSIKKIELKNQEHVSRGLANTKKITLHTKAMQTNDEIKAVLIHEIAHIVDLNTLTGNSPKKSNFLHGSDAIKADDPSIKFYKISWESNTKKKKENNPGDFVSGYAATNPFEDFAESYLFYRMHGEKFRKTATTNSILQKKYDFLKKEIFQNQEFQKNIPIPQTKIIAWDITKLPFSNENLMVQNK